MHSCWMDDVDLQSGYRAAEAICTYLATFVSRTPNETARGKNPLRCLGRPVTPVRSKSATAPSAVRGHVPQLMPKATRQDAIHCAPHALRGASYRRLLPTTNAVGTATYCVRDRPGHGGTLSEQIPDLPEGKSKRRTAVEVASEGVVGALPFVGSLLAATLSALFSATQENRTERGWRRWGRGRPGTARPRGGSRSRRPGRKPGLLRRRSRGRAHRYCDIRR